MDAGPMGEKIEEGLANIVRGHSGESEDGVTVELDPKCGRAWNS
jgi:hypothetical protein